MFGVKEINKKDNGFPTLYENVSDNIRFNKINNYKSNNGNNYCDVNNSQMLAKFSNNEIYEHQQQNDYNSSSNSNDNDDYGNIWHRNNSNSKKDVTELNSSCNKLTVSSPDDDRKSSNVTTTTSNSSYHNNYKSEKSRSNSPVQCTTVMLQHHQQQLQKKESHLNQNQNQNKSDNNHHQTDDENNENFVSDDDDDDNDDDDDDEDDDDDSTDSEFSDLSGLSDISGQDWKPMAKPINWVQKQIHLGADPREILSQILSNGTMIAPNLNDMTLWRILANILSEPPRRPKLKNINTINDVLKLLKTSKNIIVLTGAGVSVSCGIPDFRSNNGIYNRLAKDFPDLPDPQAMFDINYFSKDPRPFYKFAREIYPGQFTPSPCHRFIKLLEKKHKLLRNYTQNIDTLEQVAGIKNVIECHGSFATASCTKCKYKTTADAIRDDIFAQRIPICPQCQKTNNQSQTETTVIADGNNYEFGQINKIPSYSEIVQNGIMKPDIVFFGEGLPDAFHTAMASDKDNCDLLIVIGSSLKVRPVALIPSSIPPNVPQILINREQLNHLEFDVELLGDSDVIINHLCHLLGNDWEEVCWNSNVLHEAKHLKPKSNNTDVSSSSSIIDDDIKSHTISDFSLSSKSDNLIVDGSNSPFCDSGFDSSSSHPVYNISSSKDNQQQIQYQHQQQYQHYQHQHQKSPQQLIKGNFHQNSSISQQSSSSFPCLVSSSSSSLSSFESSSINNDENGKNILFDLKTKQKSNNKDDKSLINDDQDNNEKLFMSSKSSRNLLIDSLKDSNDTCDTLNNIPVSLTLSGTNILSNNSNNCNDNFYHTHRNHNDNNYSNNHLYHHNNDKNNFIEDKNSNQNFYNDNDNNDDGGNPNIRNTEHRHVLWSSNNKQQTSSSIPSSNSLFVTSTTSSSSPSSTINVKSIAERLLENTYYCHSKKCAYVFPGAQVFWNSDSENDDDDENDEDGNDNEDDEKEEEDVATRNNCENSRDHDKVECNDKNENHCIDDSNDTITSSSSSDDDDDDDDNNDDDNKISETPNLIYNNVKKITENKNNNYDINNENIDKNENDNDDDVPPNKRRRE